MRKPLYKSKRAGLEKQKKKATADLDQFKLPVKLGDKIEMAGLKIRVILHEREPPSLSTIYILIGAPELQ